MTEKEIKKNKEIKAKRKYIHDSIEYENGLGFSKNVSKKSTMCFFSGKSYVMFKIIEAEEVMCCYIKYMYAQDKKSFNDVFLGMINYIINRNVKFIYYSRKKNNISFYEKYLKRYNFKKQTEKSPNYKYNFSCLICQNDVDKGEKCHCAQEIFFI